jgi:menaquinone-dependent protoporphyrinogen IX oxidase
VHGDNPVVIQGGEKKALVVYQPARTGITEKAAKQIAKALNDNGYEVTLDYPNGKLSTDVSKYSVLVFGTPVYEGKFSPVLGDYIKSVNDFSKKKIMLFSTGMTDESTNKELETIEGLLKGTAAAQKVKFMTKDKTQNDQLAYDAGTKLAKE